MDRKALFKKWNAHKERTYDLKETASVKDDEGRHPDIYFIYSGRNRGKSFEIAAQCIADAYYSDKLLLYLRRNDAKGYEVEEYFQDKIEFIKDMTDGQSDNISFYRGGIYLSHISTDLKTEGKRVLDKQIGYFHAVSRQSRVKSLQFPKVFNYIYEEVLTEDQYLSGEPDRVYSIYSTFTRNKKGVRMFLISNLDSKINPYSKSWGLNLDRLKPGEIGLTKLYLNEADETGKEKYLLIACHYLNDLNTLSKEDAKKTNRNRIRNSTNRWSEARLYPHIDLRYMREHKFWCITTVMFEWDDFKYQGDILKVPENLLDVFRDELDDDFLSQKNIFILYIRRKSTQPKEGTRIYTNNPERMGRMITKGFKNICKIDEVITDLTNRGWIVGTDNVCMNDFMRIYQNLRLNVYK